MHYYIRGIIHPFLTQKGRKAAHGGEYNPVEGLTHICEFEEPDGSYFELVEADKDELVRQYMKKSSHLFKVFEFFPVKIFHQFQMQQSSEPCFALLYEIVPHIERLVTERTPQILTEFGYQEKKGILLIQVTGFTELYRFCMPLLASLTDLRIIPVMPVEWVWEITA